MNKTKAVVMISAFGMGLCAQCGSNPEGAYYEDAALSNFDKLIARIGTIATKDWYDNNISIFVSWKIISDLLQAKLDSLECTCNERTNATCPACVALLRAQEVEA